jgi:hypothetical protein
VLHKKLDLRAYMLQLMHQNTSDDRQKRCEFTALCERLETDGHFLDRVMFSNEAVFHILAKVNTVTIYGL